MTAKDVEPQKNDGWFYYNTRTFKRSVGTCLVHETDARNDDNECTTVSEIRSIDMLLCKTL